MATYSYVYRRPDLKESHKNGEFVNIHLLIGYTENTIAAFQRMEKKIRKAFPFVKRKDIQFGQVTKSSYCQGFTIAYVGIILPKGFVIPAGWSVKETGRMEYYW
jgi:hypothetical protein